MVGYQFRQSKKLACSKVNFKKRAVLLCYMDRAYNIVDLYLIIYFERLKTLKTSGDHVMLASAKMLNSFNWWIEVSF